MSIAYALRDDGLSYMGYTEQITFLLFLKIADEFSSPPYNRESLVPNGFDWQSLLRLAGEELLIHYHHILEELGQRGNAGGDLPPGEGRRWAGAHSNPDLRKRRGINE